MKRKVVAVLLALCTVSIGSVSMTGLPAAAEEVQAEENGNQYFESLNADEVNIQDAGVYTIHLKAKEGWQFTVGDNTDVTTWLVNEAGEPAIVDTEGVAYAVNGEEEYTLDITVDASKITGFTHNGADALYVMPLGNVMWTVGDNKGRYAETAAKVGVYTIPTVEVTGDIYGEIDSESVNYGETDTATVTLKLDGQEIDDSLIDSSNAKVSMQEGDGYLMTDFLFEKGTLGDTWSAGANTYTITSDTITINNGGYEFGENGGGRTFSQLGGDGGGNYYITLGLDGITYNGLPLTAVDFRTHIYCSGRTFSIDGGSLILNTEPEWSTTTEGGRPILCDTYADELVMKWPLEFDASALTEEDFTLRMDSEYGDEVVFEAGTDFTVSAEQGKTVITLNYMNWSYTPVYTTLTVDVNTDKVTYNTDKYQLKSSISHTYDIASVYAYWVMQGGTSGTQCWSFYGVDGIESWDQLFNTPLYTLSYTDENGTTLYYAEDENGNGVLVDAEELAMSFDATEDGNAQVIYNTGYYTRRYDMTEEKDVDGTTYTFDKNYGNADYLPLAIEDCTGITAQPGFVIGSSWEDHLRWPWQDFINEGYEGGRS